MIINYYTLQERTDTCWVMEERTDVVLLVRRTGVEERQKSEIVDVCRRRSCDGDYIKRCVEPAKSHGKCGSLKGGVEVGKEQLRAIRKQ